MNKLPSMLLLTGLLLSPLTRAASQWVQRQLPIQGDVWGLASNGSFVFAGTEIGFLGPGYVFRSTNIGESWGTTSGLPYVGGWVFVFSDTTLLAGSFGAGVFLSTDLGITWITPDSGMPPNANVHVLLKKGPYVFAGTAGTGNGVFRSSNDGRSWIAVDSGLTALSFLSLATNGQDLYAGTAFSGEVFRSTDDGMSWFSASNGLPVNSYIAVLTASGSNVYAGLGSGEGVYYSNNYGTNWTNISAPAAFGQVWALALVDTNLFAGSIGTGVFLTRNNGASWTAVNTGLTSLNPRSLLVSGVYLFAGTTNGYVCRRELSEIITTAPQTNDQAPIAYNLYQNYPNPFNPATNIEFSLSKSGFVSLKVYDVMGREMTTLVSEHLHAGRYRTVWNAASAGGGLPSGVYYYHLHAEDFTQSRKLILLK